MRDLTFPGFRTIIFVPGWLVYSTVYSVSIPFGEQGYWSIVFNFLFSPVFLFQFSRFLLMKNLLEIKFCLL